MPTTMILLAAAGLLAIVALSKLMNQRRIHLTSLLRDYATSRLEWARKRARAANLARQAASDERQTAEALSRLRDFAENSDVQSIGEAEAVSESVPKQADARQPVR